MPGEALLLGKFWSNGLAGACASLTAGSVTGCVGSSGCMAEFAMDIRSLVQPYWERAFGEAMEGIGGPDRDR